MPKKTSPSWTAWPLGAWRLVKYLVVRTESHAYCGSLAFFALIGFFPFCSLLLWIARHVFQSRQAETVIAQTVREYFPQDPEFLLRQLDASVIAHGPAWEPWTAIWILLGAAGVFVPLETAFNQVWGAKKHRPYWSNQAVGFLLTCACCLLAMLFVLATGLVQRLLSEWSGLILGSGWMVALRGLAVAFSMMVIFLFYKLLPNTRVPTREVLIAAFGAALVTEGVRVLYKLLIPVLRLEAEQGPFYLPVGLALLAYFESFVLIGGAFLAAGGEKSDAAARAAGGS